MPVDAEGIIEVRSLWYLAHQYLFSQATSSKFRIVQSSSWDVVDLSPRVPNFDEIRLCSLVTWGVFELFPRAVEDSSQFIHLPGNF